jgi:hypothetical protein
MARTVASQLRIQFSVGRSGFGLTGRFLSMNTCFEFHFSDEVLEKYALRSLSNWDRRPLDEHLPRCKDCRTRLMKVEEYILVVRAALSELEIHPNARFSVQSVFAL